jgi:hypothetical protein
MMETHVYRKSTGGGVRSHRSAPDQDWYPGLFYPRMSADELAMWTHWLPTASTFTRLGPTMPMNVICTLTEFHAPLEVLEEFTGRGRWGCLRRMSCAHPSGGTCAIPS